MSQSCVYLPYSQVQTPHIPVHISYFLQNCKKGKSPKKDLPYLKTISQLLNPLSDSRYIAEIKSADNKKGRAIYRSQGFIL
jgi:ribosomal protein S8